MLRHIWKCLPFAVLALGLIAITTSRANASWGWGCCYSGYSGCYSSCYSGCYTSCCSPCCCCNCCCSSTVHTTPPGNIQLPPPSGPSGRIRTVEPKGSSTHVPTTPPSARSTLLVPTSQAPRTSIQATASSYGVINVRVPSNAKVLVNGHLTKATGSERRYVSANLKPGLTYRYVIRAWAPRNGKEYSDTKVVYLTAGAQRDLALDLRAVPENALAGTR